VAKVSVRARLVASVGVLLAMIATVVGTAVLTVNSLQAANHEVSERAVPYLQGLSDAALAAKAAANDERGFLITGDRTFADEAVSRRSAEQAGLAQARTSAVSDRTRAAVDAIDRELSRFNALLDEEFALYSTDRAQAMTRSFGVNRDQRKAYEARFADAITLAKQHVAAQVADNDRGAARSRTVLAVVLLLSIVLGALAAGLLAASVTRPLAAAVGVLEGAAAGNLTRRASVVGPIEFRRMAEATNRMVAATADTVRSIAESAAGLVTTARNLTSTSDEIATVAQSTSSRAGSVSATAAQVSAGIGAVAVAAEELGTTIGGISAAVSNAAGVTGQAVTSADHAGEAVRKLDASSHQIGTVVKLITSIAEQTNLLALNATIEAARAGDAGKGFAVVAGEVKDLAQETAKATEEIATQVAAIQNDTRRAVEAIGRIGDVITSVNEYQGSIAAMVEEQSATAGEMSRSVSEIARGADGIAGDTSELADAATNTATAVDQTRHVSSTLTGMAAALQGVIEPFRY
jgi:methyl-accepting chemotaxis protein